MMEEAIQERHFLSPYKLQEVSWQLAEFGFYQVCYEGNIQVCMDSLILYQLESL